MIEDPESGALRPFDFDHLIDNVPKIRMLDYNIEHIQFDPPLDSSNMNPEHWATIAKAIANNYYDYDGFVVLHGTDTMAYTASALSFMLENLEKPVIITGSQLPIGEVRTDGEENLITALQIAATTDLAGHPMVQEVAILFENYLWRGNRATKRSADNFNAFKSNNYPELAKIGLSIQFNEDALRRVSTFHPFRVRTEMDTSVIVVDLFPGMQPEVLRHMLNTPGIKGVVLRTFGTGNGPSAKWFTDAISDAINRGIIILNVTQCVNGGVHAERYATGIAVAGVISGHDITCEAAITKMMYIFGLDIPQREMRYFLNRSLRGEVTI
jgi:L-asparaginase